MIILDFLFYHLTYYFEEHPELLSWSTPLQRAAYAIGLSTIALIFSVNEILIYEHVYSKVMSVWLFLLLGLSIVYLYQYIYLNKERYLLISSPNFFKYKIDKKTGVVITVIFIFLSIIMPFIVISITVPFGSGNVHQ